MSRPPNPATELRNLRRMLRDAHKTASTETIRANHYRERATKAEQECAEWRRRFDALLFERNSKP